VQQRERTERCQRHRSGEEIGESRLKGGRQLAAERKMSRRRKTAQERSDRGTASLFERILIFSVFFFPLSRLTSSPCMTTGRYTRLNSLDAISHAYTPRPSRLSGLRSLLTSPRHLLVAAAATSVLGLLYLLSGRSDGAGLGLAWTTGRYGAERAYSKMLESKLQVRFLPRLFLLSLLSPSFELPSSAPSFKRRC
jgi:hypothetical protein